MNKFVKEIVPYIVIVIAVLLFKSFIATPVKVSGISMVPTLHDKDIMLLNKLDKSYERFDIVVVSLPNEDIIKRIVGLPGEEIEFKDNKLYINGKYVKEKFKHAKTSDFTLSGVTKIPEDCYFVAGDNRTNSFDSRSFGFVNKNQIQGVSEIVLFPFNRFGNKK